MELKTVEDPSLMTVAEAARKAGISQTTVRSAIDRGRLPAICSYGRLLISHQEFAFWRERTRMGRPKKQPAE